MPLCQGSGYLSWPLPLAHTLHDLAMAVGVTGLLSLQLSAARGRAAGCSGTAGRAAGIHERCGGADRAGEAQARAGAGGRAGEALASVAQSLWPASRPQLRGAGEYEERKLIRAAIRRVRAQEIEGTCPPWRHPLPPPPLLSVAPPGHSPESFSLPLSGHLGWEVVRWAFPQWLKRGQQGAGRTEAGAV